MPPRVPLSLARKKFSRHRSQAKFRGIGFHFTFEEWYQWWLDNGVDKNLDIQYTDDQQRLCMCRKGDNGDYHPDNVYLASAPENSRHGHYNGKANYIVKPRKTFRYGDKLYSNREMTIDLKIDPKDLRLYRADDYDENNLKETMRLINRWIKMENKYQKYWITPKGKFSSKDLAAEAMGISKDLLGYRVKTGKYQVVKELVVPSLVDYIKTHSRYPNPVLPPDLDEYDKY
jgi:hypothetical protein